MSTLSLDRFIYYGLLLYALTSSITIAGANIAISLAGVLALIRYYREPLKLTMDSGLKKVILLFIATIILSALFAYYPLTGLNKTANYLYRMLPLFLALAFIKNKQQLYRIIGCMIISIALADLAVIWQGLHGNSRAEGFSSNYMVMGGFLLQMIPFLLVICLGGKGLPNQYRVLCIIVFVLSCMALLYNGTRGVWLAVALIIPLGLIIMNGNKKIAVGLLIALCISTFALVQVPGIKYRLDSMTNMKSGGERFLLWQSSWKMFLDNPITGIGTGNFEKIYVSRYMLPEAKEELSNAHNNFIHVLAENGVVGFSAFVYLFSYILYQSYRKMKIFVLHSWGGIALLVTLSFLIQGLTQANFVDSAVVRMYWFLLGLMQAAYNIEETKHV